MSEAQATTATGFLFTDEILRDPYPTYRRFLEDYQTFHSVPYGGGGWAVFKHAACSSLIRDSRLSAKRVGASFLALPPERRAEFGELARMLSLWLLFIDAPEHSRLRKLMNKGFSRVVVDGLRPQIEAIVDRMLKTLRHASEADVLREVAYPLPVRVIAGMFGVPELLHERFIRWSDAVAMFLGNPNRTVEQTRVAQEAVLELKEFFRGAVAERRQQKGSDLISLLLDIEEGGEVLTEEELFAQCVMLLGAGHETTRNLMAMGCIPSCGIRKKWPPYRGIRSLSGAQSRNCCVMKAPFNSLVESLKRRWKSAVSACAEGRQFCSSLEQQIEILKNSKIQTS